MTTTIVLADDHQLLRSGLKLIIARDPELQVVGEASNGAEALEAIARLQPAIAIMDVTMAGLNGMDASRRALELHPQLRVVALTMHADLANVSRMLLAGARGYVLKDCAGEELLQALYAVREGRYYLSPAVLNLVIRDYIARLPGEGASSAAILSPRERQVLQLIAEGATTKQIALRLATSIKTVETHRKRLMDKLGLDNIAALTKFALREGLTSDG